jgi:hypothetical protein
MNHNFGTAIHLGRAPAGEAIYILRRLALIGVAPGEGGALFLSRTHPLQR